MPREINFENGPLKALTSNFKGCIVKIIIQHVSIYIKYLYSEKLKLKHPYS